MATAKQIEANRRNAKRSTGPRTASGKSKSSRNALRHGLSLPLTIDGSTMAEIDELARLLAHGEIDNTTATVEVAAAQVDLQRIQRIRRDVLAKIDLATATPKELHICWRSTVTKRAPGSGGVAPLTEQLSSRTR
jgi:hypothetical protein